MYYFTRTLNIAKMIEIKELTFGYKKSDNLFKDLDLSIEKGNVYGLLGKNGAGKSTLLKIMCGLLYAHKGTVNFEGSNVATRQPKLLADMYMLPEEFHLPDLYIETYIKIYSVFYPNFNHELIDKLIVEFEITKSKKLNTLSYGQKKKFMIAFAIATECSIVFMDEPTNGLDIPSKSKFRRIIAEATNENRTFLISTHQVRDLENLIDPIVIIEEGKIIFNENMESISNKLSFIKAEKEASFKSKVFHSEAVFGGQYIVADNMDKTETAVDFELLFNAVLSNTSEIVEHLKN